MISIKGLLFNILAIVLIISFALFDLMLIGILSFEDVIEPQKVCISVQNNTIDNDVILQNSEV